MILVTGGTGYIGSHACVELLSAGRDILILDNFCNSQPEVANRIAGITGRQPQLVHGDIRDGALLDTLFTRHRIDAVLHFAGLKAVGESVALPLHYYDNNVHGSMVLLRAMQDHGVQQLVFSSSATVYGDQSHMPITETAATSAANPYGRSKLMVEEMLQDIAAADPQWKIAILRYFNPVGAHASGLLGESPNGIPNNLMPYLAQVAAGQLERLAIYGDDYPTPDGTGVRDFIHVVDLAQGHLRALEKLAHGQGVHIYNLGTGRGHSVLEMLRAFEQASQRTIPFRIAPRRAGDVAVSYANPAKAQSELGWQASRGIEEMCVDAWRWQQHTTGDA